MAATTIEITIISAEDLRLGRRPLNRDAFVAVRAGHDRHHEATTNLDGEGGSYPCWNQRFTMTLSPSTRSISVEVLCRSGGAAGACRVAATEVPVSDFRWPENYLHFLRYRLRC